MEFYFHWGFSGWGGLNGAKRLSTPTTGALSAFHWLP